MKRESVNTFSGGLTYDINPITTPNNVLTDGVNATFLTFNGDEMALQNDAGNTRIIASYGESNKETYNPDKIYYKNALVVYDKKLYYCKEDGVTGAFDTSKWTIVTDSVKLSDGFKPIGLKEHGGILYIVSHKKTEGSDEFEIGSYPSPGYRKADIITDTTPIEVVNVDGITNRLGEFIQLSNSELFPGDPYRITFSNKANLTINGDRKFYTFEFYLKPKEGDFIALKDIKTVNNLTPFYSNEVGNGVSFLPNNGSGKLFIKFELEDIDEFTQYSEIDGDKYYFPRLDLSDEGIFIEFDYFNIKHGSEIKLDAIDMEYTLINSQTGEAAEGTPKEFEVGLATISEDGEFECKDEGNNFFRVQTPNTAHILEYTFTPKNKYYNILFNNHIIKNSIDLSIDPLLWGNYLTYSEEEKGNFYFQSPDLEDSLIFKTMSADRSTFKIDYLNWLTDNGEYFSSDVNNLKLHNSKKFSYFFNNRKQGRDAYHNSVQTVNYTPLFDYKDFSTVSTSVQNFEVLYKYRSPAFSDWRHEKYKLVSSVGEWLEPTWWNSVIGEGINSETYGADYAVFMDENDNVISIVQRELGDSFWTSRPSTITYDSGYYLSRKPSVVGTKYLKVNEITVKSDPVCSPGTFHYLYGIYGGNNLINSIEIVHHSSYSSPIETYIGEFVLTQQYVDAYNKGKEITLMKKATANFEGELKPTTYDFKEAILNTSDNLIEPPSELTVRQSNIVSEGMAQRRYLLSNTSTTKVISDLTAGEKYTLAFYLITEKTPSINEGGTSSINVSILGKEYTINYKLDEGVLKTTVVGSSPYTQNHNHYTVDGLYVNNIPIEHNNWYYSYVKYTFEYGSSGNLILSTSNTFEISELTLKKGIIIPQSVQVYQDMLHGKIDDSLKSSMYQLTKDEVDKNVLGKLYIPNTNYEIRGVL